MPQGDDVKQALDDGSYDAAVIDKEDGKPHIVKRMDRPRIRIVPEVFGSGTLPHKELHEAAEDLTANEAGLIAVGEPTIEKAVDKAIANAAKVTKRYVDAATDQIADELRGSAQGLNGRPLRDSRPARGGRSCCAVTLVPI